LTHDIKTKSIIRNETASMDKSNINMEYKNLPSGSSGKSYFEMSLFKRNLKQSFLSTKKMIHLEKRILMIFQEQ